MATTTGTSTQGITPFLWFNGNVEEALNFYTSVFEDSKIASSHRLPAEVPGRGGQIMTATIILNGVEFMLLDGGPQFTFTPAISFFVKCETQAEVDHYWEKLSEGGRKDRCGWLTDKYGISWQIVPNALGRLMYNSDPAKARKVMDAMMQMSKIEIAGLEEAYNS
ncbi:VOC family protein [Mucilaginibacter sp. BJC16-A38]|uniref:VOC family protein n=1 Tax=Mucilaginibacter phenanthrenivorans TaxID=1234842 RepID=UPI002158460B|nr:VOC family protein [Mucilaginibacter phenanthrenivorans]MCR8557928.1 VOC family protein [Mucilaginibacter phenanthrenivorans]